MVAELQRQVGFAEISKLPLPASESSLLNATSS
jgi:hypothetical protein